MKEALYSLCTGLIAGGVFSFLKLPIPAPPTLSGLLGVVGLFIGYILVKQYLS